MLYLLFQSGNVLLQHPVLIFGLLQKPQGLLRQQLLLCTGRRSSGTEAESAEAGHVVCAPCLTRWWASQTSLRADKGAAPLVRRLCPVCTCELRAADGDRRNSERYAMGLLKVAGTW